MQVRNPHSPESVEPIFDKIELDLKLDAFSAIPSALEWTEQTLLSGGKQIRPRLCLWMGQALGLPVQELTPFARIAEWVHSATLAHDDVIDAATERRGRPTLNVRLSQAKAVLSGDILLSRSMVQLADLEVIEALKGMAWVLEDLVTGEWLQLEMRGNLQVSARLLEHIAKLKTASLIEWCVQVPFWKLKLSEDSIRLARMFGYHLGLAFQKVDDVLDYEATSGKDYLKDLKEGLMNSVSVMWLEHLPLPLGVTTPQAWATSLESDGVSQSELEALEWAKQQVRQQASLHVDAAVSALEQLKPWFSTTPSAVQAHQNILNLSLELKRRTR